MRTPPDNRNARRQPGVGSDLKSLQPSDTTDTTTNQAIPPEFRRKTIQREASDYGIPIYWGGKDFRTCDCDSEVRPLRVQDSKQVWVRRVDDGLLAVRTLHLSECGPPRDEGWRLGVVVIMEDTAGKHYAYYSDEPDVIDWNAHKGAPVVLPERDFIVRSPRS